MSDYTQSQLDEMTAELRRDFGPCYSQWRSGMKSRWGGDYSDDLFDSAWHAATDLDDDEQGGES